MYVAGIEVEGVQSVVTRLAACFAQHGQYQAGHRCQHSDRGHRRQDPAPKVADLDREHEQAGDDDDGKEEKGERKAERKAAVMLGHEEEMTRGLLGANQHGQVVLKSAGNAVQCIVVTAEAANIRAFKEVYKQIKGHAPPLSGLDIADLGEPMPYWEAGVQFEYGEQSMSSTLCSPFVCVAPVRLCLTGCYCCWCSCARTWRW